MDLYQNTCLILLLIDLPSKSVINFVIYKSPTNVWYRSAKFDFITYKTYLTNYNYALLNILVEKDGNQNQIN